MTLGTGNELTEPNLTQYRQPWAVQVTDANGNAVASQEVQIAAIPLRCGEGGHSVGRDEVRGVGPSGHLRSGAGSGRRVRVTLSHR
ncbi:MAG: hypothetical protein U5L11_15505 [Arhodomonas sp.]|nr:hypothetical protein [Arhodomonas sp.]